MKKPQVFRGVATALITPFINGVIDYATLDTLIEKQISGGVSALVIGGTTGETATLDEGERRELYKYAYERVAGRAGIILGVGTNDTRASVIVSSQTIDSLTTSIPPFSFPCNFICSIIVSQII